MISQPISWYTARTSAALPTPCFPSTVIVRTLWVAMTCSLLRARSRLLLACRRAARRPALPLCLLFLASIFLFFYFFVHKLLSSNFCPRSRLSFWSHEEGSRLSFPASARPSYTPERSLMLTHGRISFLRLSATVLQQFVWLYRWYERFGAWVF